MLSDTGAAGVAIAVTQWLKRKYMHENLKGWVSQTVTKFLAAEWSNIWWGIQDCYP
jgi:hypothetical protein